LKILLLGSTGQLGSDILRELSKSNLFNIYAPISSELDLSKKNFIDEIFNKKFDYIINCVAIHDLNFSENNKDQSYLINADVPKKLAEYCEQKNCNLIHFSTDYVFDGKKKNNLEYTEQDLVNPLNIYGSSKVMGEKKIKSIFDNYYILRISTLFGSNPPRGKKYNFVDAIINKFNNKEIIKVVSDQISKPTSTLYIAKVVKEIIEKKFENGIYHLTNNQSLSFYDYSIKILKHFSSNFSVEKISYDDLNLKVQRPKFSSLDSSKIYSRIDLNNNLDFYLYNYIKEKYV
tara:strand:+ start:4124 stop:4990 length:867 start_codon:yes stop_codon:yes gene_type:complete